MPGRRARSFLTTPPRKARRLLQKCGVISFRQFLGCIFALALISCAASAQVSIITSLGPGTANASGGDNTLGFDFTVGDTPLTVTELGLWDENGDGLENSHWVGLWDDTGALLTSVNVSSGTTAILDNGFRFTSLATPVILQAGHVYVLGASYLTADADRVILNYGGGSQAGSDPAITLGNLHYTNGGGFTFPGIDAGYGSEIGPNAIFAGPVSVPEPSSLSLILMSCGSASAFLLRRKAKRP